MEIKKTVIWEVIPAGVPELWRYCKKCKMDMAFRSSGLFRVNAQQKTLDVWLIYRCASCGCTWNMTVLSRVNRKSLDGQMLEGFMTNDGDLARQYAMDMELIKRNGVRAEAVSFAVTGEELDFERHNRLILRCPYLAGIKVTNVLRQKLGLSASQAAELVESGAIALEGGGDIHRAKLGKEVILILDRYGSKGK